MKQGTSETSRHPNSPARCTEHHARQCAPAVYGARLVSHRPSSVLGLRFLYARPGPSLCMTEYTKAPAVFLEAHKGIKTTQKWPQFPMFPLVSGGGSKKRPAATLSLASPSPRQDLAFCSLALPRGVDYVFFLRSAPGLADQMLRDRVPFPRAGPGIPPRPALSFLLFFFPSWQALEVGITFFPLHSYCSNGLG